MRKLKFLILFIILDTALVVAQNGFLVGAAIESIEPPQELFSVALAGYGAPREGRFSLQWNFVSNVSDFKAVSAFNNTLYGVGDGLMYIGSIMGESIQWKKIRGAQNVTAIANVNGQLYVIKKDNYLYKASIAGDKLQFKKVGTAKGIISITGLKTQLYGADALGNFYKAIGLPSKLSWKKMLQGSGCDQTTGVQELTSDDDRLYAINKNDTLYLADPQANQLDWRIIGRYNSYTFKIKIKHIVVVNKRLYAIDDENRIFIASHQTKGNMKAQAIAIKKDNKTVLIIGADVAGFDFSFSQKIKNIIKEKTGIPEEAIIINAAHNHFAPVNHYAWRTWQCFYQKPDPKYVNEVLLKGMLNAAFNAIANIEPAQIDFYRGYTNIGVNRRSMFYLDAPYDGTLDVLATRTKNNDIKNLLFVAGCHPVFNNTEKNSTFTLSANYPGIARETIQRKLTNTNPFFIQGCGGDINPASDNYEITGKELGTDVLNLLEQKPTAISGSISYSMDVIKIPIRKFSLQEVKDFKKLNEQGLEIEKKYVKPYTPEGQFQLTELMEREKNIRWSEMMLEKYTKGTVKDYLPLYIQTITIGNWKFVGLSREVTTEYAKAIRNLWPDKTVTVAAYCNDVDSYLPNRWHVMYKTYEGYDSFFWYGRPGLPYPNVFNTVMDAMKNIRD
ncbi:MAG: hypothetical protein ACK5NK_13205 [Niabella sp.]